MRVWDISPNKLCKNHLLGEHNEIHSIFSIISNNKKGYSNHPEVKRWEGKLKALHKRHQMVVKEMLIRGYEHKSPLNSRMAKGRKSQDRLVNTIEEQIEILRQKRCECRV